MESKLVCGISFTCIACGEGHFCAKKPNHRGSCGAFDGEYHATVEEVLP